MLSILLPIYNFPCFDLAKELSEQTASTGIPFEMICIEDGSTQFKENNQAIRDLPNTTYIESDENIGRSCIRNLLVSKARYDYVLFLDCDSAISHKNYILNYLQAIDQYDIISGGRHYESLPPVNPRYHLHWKYGSMREPKPDDLHKTFNSNNFIIKKTIIEQYPFNENIVRYGHEDSYFQMELEKSNRFIHFIYNPVIHIGLEPNDRFLEKTKESLINLCDLYHSGSFEDLNLDKIRLLKAGLLIGKYKLIPFFRWLYPVADFLNTKINLGGHPNLWVLDLYKLAFFACLLEKNGLKS